MTTRKIVSKAPEKEEEEVEEVENVKLDKDVDTNDIDSVRLAYWSEVAKEREKQAEAEAKQLEKDEKARAKSEDGD